MHTPCHAAQDSAFTEACNKCVALMNLGTVKDWSVFPSFSGCPVEGAYNVGRAVKPKIRNKERIHGHH